MPRSPDSSRFKRLEEIFDRAIELEADARAAYLDDACAGEAKLREEVEALLRAAEQPGPLDHAVGTLAAEVAQDATHRASGGDYSRDRRIGPWRILDTLGTGGMGRVFLAERAESSFEQRAALKILRWELAEPRLVDRFQKEQQILARLEHPSIARLIDGGISQDGLPYLAMEYVDGAPIDEAVTALGADFDERLRLWMQVAEVVEFAHHNLVVHRDLKPSNILVDVDGRIRLLDFGVARIVDESLDDLHRTQTVMAPVTPSCAAPEQLRGGNITTATDVWALGVLLYQLLCETHPFEVPGKSQETTRRILEEQPELPSRCAVHHRHRLRGDLDNILAKALAKDPDQRYGSVESLLEDVHRHLEGQPVLAHPPGATYRAGKWIHRHRQALAVTVAIVLGMGSLTVYYTRRVSAERDQALAEKVRTEKVKQFVESLFIENDPSVSKGEEITAREMLDRGAVRIEAELEEEPDIAADLHEVVGELYSSLGIYDLAQDHLTRTVALRREVLGSDSSELAESLDRLANVLREQDDLDGAIESMREALQIARLHPKNREGLASILNGLGLTLAYRGDYEEAEQYLREAVRIDTEIHGEMDANTAVAMANLGLAIKWNGDFDAAEPIYRRVLEIRRVDPGRLTPEYAISLDNLGVLLGQRGDYEESEELFLEALDIRRQILGEEHPDVAMNLNNLATLYRVQGRLDKAEPMYRQVLALNRRIHGPRHRTVATNLHNLGSVLLARQDYGEARKAFEGALDIRREALGPDHIEVAMTENQLVSILNVQGDRTRADSLSRDAVKIARAAVDAGSPQLAAILANRGELLLDLGRAERAETVLEEAVSIEEQALSPGHWELGRSHALLGECRAGLQKADAESLLVKGLRSLQGARGDDFPATKRARESLRRFYADQGRTEDAARVEGGEPDGF